VAAVSFASSIAATAACARARQCAVALQLSQAQSDLLPYSSTKKQGSSCHIRHCVSHIARATFSIVSSLVMACFPDFAYDAPRFFERQPLIIINIIFACALTSDGKRLAHLRFIKICKPLNNFPRVVLSHGFHPTSRKIVYEASCLIKIVFNHAYHAIH
jgi:hypothetical protein